jgi:uncharacterized protein (DUF1810 family)
VGRYLSTTELACSATPTAAPMPLRRFIDAQDDPETGFANALAEIRAGAKRGHWIWYVFPQLAGLGESYMAQMYALRDVDEAIAYANDALLGVRLLTITAALVDHLKQGRPLASIMGSRIDALKAVSSLTLFEHAASGSALAAAAREALDVATAQGYPRCAFTLQAIAGAAGSTPPAGAPPT